MKKLRVGLLWHAFGHANLGVDALARANAQLIREAASGLGLAADFITLGTGARRDVALPPDVMVGPHPSIRQALRGRSDFMAAIRGCDIVFDIGEGDSFTDLYGARRFAYQAGTKLAVLAAGVPLVLSPQTIGPFAAPQHRALAGWLLRRAQAVHARDGLSAGLALRLGARRVMEFTDVAFALPFAPQRRDGAVRVGLNVSGLLWNGAQRTRLDYRALMGEVIAGLAGHEVWLVAHVNGREGADTDEPVADALARLHPQLRRAPTFADSADAKGFLSGMDFVVAARMHAAIAAFSAGVPVVPLAYSRKVNGLFGSLDYPHFVDAQADDIGRARAKILDGFAHRAELAAAVNAGRIRAAERLAAYRAELTRLLTPFAEGKQERQLAAA